MLGVLFRGWLGPAALACAMVAGCTEDPFDYGGPRSCEVPDRNAWVYSLMGDAYLWAAQMPEVDPASYDSPGDMVADLRVDPDRWSRVSDKARTNALFEEGKIVGLGFRTRRDRQNRVVVSWVTPGSNADGAGMRRGDVMHQIDGFTIAQIDAEDRWDEVYGDDVPGVAVPVQFERPGEVVRNATLIKDWLEIETVPVADVLELDGRPVGYLLFATFVDTADARLDETFEAFRDAGVRDVIVDLRYNGGGRIAVARHLIDLLVGDVADGHVSYGVDYGPGLSDQDTRRRISRRDGSVRDLGQIIFITTGSTLSASELVINAVRPWAEVRLVGGTTGGKPVGSHQWEFCDQILQPITFKLTNAEGYGEYFDGLTADCPSSDELDRDIGDPQENSLATALHVLSTGACPPPPPVRDPSDAADGEHAELPPRGGLEELRGVF
ncbi:MAG: S41 family peptidase [Nannocystaceae bacterium]|jgi:C-terminal processing protease CtpA/Prc